MGRASQVLDADARDITLRVAARCLIRGQVRRHSGVGVRVTRRVAARAVGRVDLHVGPWRVLPTYFVVCFRSGGLGCPGTVAGG